MGFEFNDNCGVTLSALDRGEVCTALNDIDGALETLFLMFRERDENFRAVAWLTQKIFYSALKISRINNLTS